MTRFIRYGWAILHLVSLALATDRIHGERDPSRLYFAVEIDSSIVNDPNTPFNLHSSMWTYEHPLDSIPNHHLFSVPMGAAADDLVDMGPHIPKHLQKRSPFNTKLAESGVISLEVLHSRQLHKRLPVPFERPVDSSVQAIKDLAKSLDIHDPMFPSQWHLFNPVQPGHDINVTGLWAQNITGEGIRVAVIDDGLDMDNKDLKNNFFQEGSWDFNDPGPFPKPRLSDDRHGTRCAGEIAAVRNDVCGVGVAYDSKVAGIRILSKRIMPADEAQAINFAMDKNHIYSCSWGPSDDGQTMEGPPEIVKKAMLNAVQNGRDGKGNLYVFASGNGGNFHDNCNFDGYTNSIYSITVASIDRRGLHPGYSESCSANMVVTYSSGSGDFIHTTDVNGACSSRHGGTSAAAPIAAGIYALVLSVNPELTWRDLQYLTFETALPFDVKAPGWQKSGSGKYFNHEYGFGKLDAYEIVERAKSWELVNPQAWYHLPIENVDTPIPSSDQGVEFKTTVTVEGLKKANFKRLEHVNVLVNAEASRRGDLSMQLISPSGMVSNIMPMRYLDSSRHGVKNWKFMSVAHWGEAPEGEWRLIVHNAKGGSEGAKLIDWQLQLWGESSDGDKAMVFPGTGKLSKENGESNGNKDNWETSEDENAASQSTDSPASTSAPDSSVASDVHPATSSAASDAPSDVPSPAISGASSTASPISESSVPAGSSAVASAAPGEHSHSLVPTFGMSGRTAAWVYGSALIILLFIGGVSLYIFMARRRNNRKEDNSYAFNPLLNRTQRGDDEEEGEELEYLNEFSLGESDDEDSTGHRRRSDDSELSETLDYLPAGKKARDLYSNSVAQGAGSSLPSSAEEITEKSRSQDDDSHFTLEDSDDEHKGDTPLINK